MMKKQGEAKYGVSKKITLFILIPAIGIIIFFLLFFPPLIKAYLINSLKEMRLENPQFTIRHVGFNQLDIQHFSVGETNKPGLTIANLGIDFSWLKLLKNRIRKIEITGMTLHAEATREGFIIYGLEPLFEKKAEGKPTIPFDHVDIGSSVIQFIWEGHSLTIPFSLSAVYIDPEKKADFSMDLIPYGETINVKGTINMDSGNGIINIAAVQADLGKYFNDFNITSWQWLKSRLRLNAQINVSDWGIRDSHISLTAPDFAAGISGGNVIKGSVNLDFKLNRQMQPEDVQLKLRVENIDDKMIQVEIPFNLDIVGSNLNNLQLKLDHLKLKQPPGIHFRDFNGTASLDKGQLQAQGTFACGINPEFIHWLSPGITMAGGLSFKGDVQVLANNKETTWNLTGAGGGKVSVTSQDMQAGIDNLGLSLAAVGKGDHIANRLDVELKGLAIKYEDLDFFAGNVLLQNNIETADRKNWAGTGNAKFTAARVKQINGINAQGIHLDLPWQYPFTTSKPGDWAIASLKLGDLNLGKLAGGITQNEAGCEFSGEILTPVESLKMKITGNLQWLKDKNEIGASLQINIPETQIVKDSQLKRLHPALAGYRLLGYISGSGTINYLQGNLTSGARLKFRDIEMESDTGGIKAQGMNADIVFKDLINFKTEVAQRIDFNSIDVSGLQLAKSHLVFEIISPESIYIEGGEFAFSGGRLLLQPLRYNLNGKDLKITIYGDRINFAEMVNKLQGEQIAFGEAELNGLLSVGISDGIPVFRDGYLYSTPGVGGNIKFVRSETISGGVLLVEEAIKNFNYEWIKLKLDTVKDKLNITAFINGVPADKLPLTYDMKTRDIVRDKEGRRTLELKGLLLELRFKELDLKRLMRGGLKIYSQEKEKKSPVN